MKDIREVYPQEGSGRYFCESDYQPMLSSLGYPILLQVDDSGYQGDSRVLFQDGQRYGLLIFGWGSCSGCDALQGCHSYEEIEALRVELFEDIKWFDSKAATLDYLVTHDWEGDYSWWQTETQEFLTRAKELLAGKE